MTCIKEQTKAECKAQALIKEFGHQLWLSGVPIPRAAELEKMLHETVKTYFDALLNRR